ncbi:MAG: hypothetical protein LKG27_03950 [Clostridiaceae bacterium]|jgi:cephalosporin hydroxylase|nr:hypothetical protein [Clostridiaceae bacterium]
MFNNTLDDLGLKYNTDKASTWGMNNQSYLGHNYLKSYELFMAPMKKEAFTLVELGCFQGASLKMWKEYFKKAEIVGVDLDENLKAIEEKRISFICSDATSQEFPEKLSQYKNIKCIIDDCSHAWADQRISLEMLFPILESGGYYIIEDLECGTTGAYPNFPPKIEDSQSFWDYAMDRLKILRVSESINQQAFRPFFSQLPQRIQQLELSIAMSIIIPGAIIFRKK